MSYTKINALYKTTVTTIDELENGHLSAQVLWGFISQKYRNKEYHVDTNNFWPIYKDSRICDHEKAVLLSTYDWSYVAVKNLLMFAKSCHIVHDTIIAQSEYTWTHFKDIGNIATLLYKKHHRLCIGLCISVTSVYDIWRCYTLDEIKSWEVYNHIGKIGQSKP